MVLTQKQLQFKESIKNFIDSEIIPNADQYDKEECIPKGIFKKLGVNGYLGSIIPSENNKEIDMIINGLLCEEISRGSASLLSVFTVQGMVSMPILKWGTNSQKEYWLPRLSKGESIAAFALTEPNIGSDAKNVQTKAVFSNGSYILNGEKKWISGGQIANFFLIIAICDGSPAAFLVERDTPGLSIKPIKDMLGFRSAMLAELIMEECTVPKDNLLGQIGFGFSHIAGTGLDYGRYAISWGSVGLSQACLETCIQYTRERKQFDKYLKDHQLVQEMIADMVTNIKAARLLCYHAGYLRNNGDSISIIDTSIAKYFASRIALKAATDAVQIHGANGCSSDYPVQRYYRDAKIMEIIEGSNQIQQTIISNYAYY